MSEVLAVPCLLCNFLLDFNNGKFEKHMEIDHSLTTDHVSFFVAIHLLTEGEREKVQIEMRERVREKMVNENTDKGQNTLEEGQMPSNTEMQTKIEITNVMSVEDDLLNEEEDDDILCSFDGVKIAKQSSLETFKESFFSDTLKTTRQNSEGKKEPKVEFKKQDDGEDMRIAPNDDEIQCSFDGVKIFRDERLEQINLEMKEGKSKIKRDMFVLRCELCHKRFSGMMRRHNYRSHMNRKHNEPKIEAILATTYPKQDKGDLDPKLVRDTKEQSVMDPLAAQVNVETDTLEEEKKVLEEIYWNARMQKVEEKMALIHDEELNETGSKEEMLEENTYEDVQNRSVQECEQNIESVQNVNDKSSDKILNDVLAEKVDKDKCIVEEGEVIEEEVELQEAQYTFNEEKEEEVNTSQEEDQMPQAPFPSGLIYSTLRL